MSFAATPQRPLPGAYLATPAASRQQAGPPPPPLFRNTSASNAQAPGVQRRSSSGQAAAAQAARAPAEMNPIQRAARTINDALAHESRYPELDSYITQGISSDYDLPPNQAWAPFQKTKTYDIPERIFEQYNQAQVSTMMGLFAELNHAWVTIDNAFYLWDYTSPNPELIGFEENPNSITVVKLVTPRKGVFVDKITRLLVIATTADIFLIGVDCSETGAGVKQVSLYQTRMQLSVRGIDVCCIEGSPATGRIFFGGRADDDVYEITYQQEDNWFASKCGKRNHVTERYKAVIPNVFFGRQTAHEYVMQIVVDDTRNLVYTLSSLSTIRVFSMSPPNSLVLSLTKSYSRLKINISHMVSRSDLLGPNSSVVAVVPISLNESLRLNLMVVTSTGCRIFLSATSGNYYHVDPTSTPSSMQVHHVKFPPGDPHAQSSVRTVSGYGSVAIDTNSGSLTTTRRSSRFPPGYFLCFVQGKPGAPVDQVFLSAPDSGRISRPQEHAHISKYAEFGLWIGLNGSVEDIGSTTASFAAANTPAGFGNELAVQFDQAATEIAILTNTGVETVRRRRLVDIFAAAIRHGGGDEGLEGEINRFVRLYGRGETTATALAVACGQGLEALSDMRASRNTDQDILEFSRRAFIEFGGKANYNEDSVLDANASLLDNVKPSPRHEGIALYVARLVRSAWRTPILLESTSPTGGLVISPNVPMAKLKEIQRDLTRLQEFLTSNRSFIEGLDGPGALSRVATRQEEIALQGEHRALESLVRMIGNIIEGLAFVQVLFEEPVEDIVLTLSDTSRQRVRQLTFEGLFATDDGKELAKDLVKAIVNRNIASGSNVDTVADALRRRCGSFCSPEDVVIFKAQEQLNRASENGAATETGRALLNESLKLFERVAESLTMEHLQWAVDSFQAMRFYAGAIRLCLRVAKERDRADQALAWTKEGRPQADKRKELFKFREDCYELILSVITAVDDMSSAEPETVDGQTTISARRRSEAYDEVNNSQDKLFQTHLYNWYMGQGWSDRLLQIKSEHAVEYLQQKSKDDLTSADLLWQYFAHYGRFFDAAEVQLRLATSDFEISLDMRLEYLSRARTNASTRIASVADFGEARRSRQKMLREISDLIDIASIQGELLQRIRSDPRIAEQRRPEIIRELDGKIHEINLLYHDYADAAQYYDICLLIYYVAGTNIMTHIETTWRHLIEQENAKAEEAGHGSPWEVVADKVRALGTRLGRSETVFPTNFLIAQLLRYALRSQGQPATPTWVLDIFLSLSTPHDQILAVLEHLLYSQEPPFDRRSPRALVAREIVRVIDAWFEHGLHSTDGGPPFGSEEMAVGVEEMLRVVQESGLLDEDRTQDARHLRFRIDKTLR